MGFGLLQLKEVTNGSARDHDLDHASDDHRCAQDFDAKGGPLDHLPDSANHLAASHATRSLLFGATLSGASHQYDGGSSQDHKPTLIGKRRLLPWLVNILRRGRSGIREQVPASVARGAGTSKVARVQF